MKFANDPQEEIEIILDNFEFEKVRDVMKFLEWGWVDLESGGEKVPAIPRLRTTARRLLKICVEELEDEPFEAASGGFHAHAFRDANGILRLRLDFVLDSYDNYD